MLRTEELRFELYRTAAGCSERIVHVPTGVERWHAGQMPRAVRVKLVAEIEGELRENGLTQFILPDPPIKPSF